MRAGQTFQLVSLLSCCLALASAALAIAAETKVDVGDAYVRGSADGQRWSIGTQGVEMTFESRDGGFRTAGFQNRLVSPPLEYIDAKGSAAPFLASTQHFVERYTIETLWGKPMVGPVTLDPAADNVRITVKKGDRIGFAVGPHGDYSSDHLRWPVTVDYGDGERYDSAAMPRSSRGPCGSTPSGCSTPASCGLSMRWSSPRTLSRTIASPASRRAIAHRDNAAYRPDRDAPI